MDPFLLLFIGIVIVIGGIVWLKMHAFVALFSAAIVVAALTPKENIEQTLRAQNRPEAEISQRVNESLGAKLGSKFGNTATSLGVLVAMASIVGGCLLASGGADRIVRSTLKFFGEKRSPLVFGTSGYILGIPVFFDTVFLLLIPLARTMARRTGRNYLLYVLATAAGATMTHSLVPPTPGPLFVANALKVEIWQMMIGGIIISSFAACGGLAYAWWANLKWPTTVPVREDEEASAIVERPEADLPPLWLALAPIVLPVVFITGAALRTFVPMPAPLADLISSIGHPNIALSIAAAIGLGTVAWQHRREGMQALKKPIQAAIADAGSIILITAAGGVFGGVLQETGVGERIQGLAAHYQLAVLPLAFVVTALIRGAQGSATVAMVTAVGILQGFATAGPMGFHPIYLALIIGCASKLLLWMNDSGFWVVSKTAGLTERETLRTMSVMFSLMGTVGFFVVLVAAHFFPLV